MPNRNPTGPSITWGLPAFACALYAAVCALLLISMHHANRGPIVSPLDDTYIHMALAESISRGFYAINAGHPASPSSSILWPFLLAPFARLHSFFYVPLVLNLLIGFATAAFLGFFVTQLPAANAARTRRLVTVAALLFIANLPALTMLAMEHTLQCLLAAVCAYAMLRALRGESIPTWAIAAAIVAPAVRYECFTLTLAMACALWAQRRHRALASLALAFIAPIAMGIFFHHLGLPFLPMSVLNKAGSSINTPNTHFAVNRHLHEFIDNLRTSPAFWVLFLLSLLLACAAFRSHDRLRRWVLAGSSAACALHLLIGRIGFLNRYEPYIVLFGSLVFIEITWRAAQSELLALALWPLCSTYVLATGWIPAGSHDIYVQQYQTARLAHSLPNTNVAVNDLGLVALDHPSTQYVLDLAGLGSTETYADTGNLSFLDSVTRRDNIGLVAIFPNWFASTPRSWTELGRYCRSGPGSCVVVYATGLTPVAPLRDAFTAFAKTVPPEAHISVTPITAPLAAQP